MGCRDYRGLSPLQLEMEEPQGHVTYTAVKLDSAGVQFKLSSQGGLVLRDLPGRHHCHSFAGLLAQLLGNSS